MISRLLKTCLTIFFGSVFIWLCGYFIFLSYVLLSKPQTNNNKADAIIVLTGGNQRIESGLELFARGDSDHLMITGVHPNATKFDIVKRWSRRSPALPDCCVTLGYKATTTVENALETRDFLKAHGYDSIKLVTADYHMPRAHIEFSHALPDVQIITHPIVQPDTTPKQKWFWIITFIEYHKTLMRGMILLTTPHTYVQKGAPS